MLALVTSPRAAEPSWPGRAHARSAPLASPDGPVVLEVEVTEPCLDLDVDPGTPARSAAVFRSLGTWADRAPNGSSSRP